MGFTPIRFQELPVLIPLRRLADQKNFGVPLPVIFMITPFYITTLEDLVVGIILSVS